MENSSQCFNLKDAIIGNKEEDRFRGTKTRSQRGLFEISGLNLD